MRRYFFFLFYLFVSAGCVYRGGDIPNVPYLEVEPKKIYIYAEGKEYQWQAASNLATDSQQAGFEPAIVSDLSEINDGSYIIESIEPLGECLSEPLLTVLTLGVIPHIGCEEYGYAFMLHQKGSQVRTRVDAKYTVKVMVGWLTWPAALGSGYSFTSTTPDVELKDQTPINLLRRELANAMQ